MSKWLYHDAMYRFDMPERSYWEATRGEQVPIAPRLETDESCEVAIIGGGYTGLSAAYHLSRDHQVDARVLEAGHMGWGASGRNGGFCSVGGDALGGDKLVERYGLEETGRYYRGLVDAVDLVRSIIVEERIDTPRQGDGEIAIALSGRSFDELKRYAERQFRVLGLDASVLTREECRERYLDSPLQHGAIRVRPTFGIHPLRYVQGLARAAEQQGAQLHAASEVIEWVKDGSDHVLVTRHGSLRARYVVLATNGFMPEHLDKRMSGWALPLISAIVVTRPLTDEELAAQRWHTESPTITAANLLNYFRLLPDRRFMFGGRGSANGDEASARRNYRVLIRQMHELFPAWRDVDVEYRWHGLVCMTRRLTPAIGRLDDDPSVLFAFGYHGNGVSTGTWAGKQVADWLGSSERDSRRVPEWLPGIVHGSPGRLPVASLRLAYIQLAITMLRLADKVRS